ncbi:MAG: twin-arginine translocase subunit TatC [Moraxellaceae bacterium]|nr:twin-arginine translocase subunit TatC [Pseudobdellovibrionaceae bacterium]
MTTQDNTEPGSMGLIQHIAELRFRLTRAAIFILLGTVICWGFSEYLFNIIRQPIAQYLPNGGLVFTGPIDKFMAHIKLAFIAGMVLSAPLWLYQLWKFISPALYKNEKKYAAGFILFGTFQFILGVLFCYFIVFPMAFKFLMTFGGDIDKPMITIDSYLGFFTQTAVIFGLTFEMPVIITFLGSMGLISQEFLKKNRRYAVVIMAAVSAIAAPPDALSMILLLGPLWVMYELSVVLVGLFGKKSDPVV